MPWERKRLYTTIIFLGALLAGIILLAIPTSTQINGPEYAAQVTKSELDASIGYAPPGYLAEAHITAQNQVTVTLTLTGTSAVLFSQTFAAGTFDVPQVTIVNGGNVFLTIRPQNGAYTQITVFARIFHNVVTYQYTWLGVLTLGGAGLLGLALFFPETLLGRSARLIIPLKKVSSYTRPGSRLNNAN